MLYVFRVWFFLQRTLNGQPGDDHIFNCAYSQHTCIDGYRYKGRSIGSPVDNDARITTLGGACAGLGYDYRKDTLTNISDGDVRVFLNGVPAIARLPAQDRSLCRQRRTYAGKKSMGLVVVIDSTSFSRNRNSLMR